MEDITEEPERQQLMQNDPNLRSKIPLLHKQVSEESRRSLGDDISHVVFRSTLDVNAQQVSTQGGREVINTAKINLNEQ